MIRHYDGTNGEQIRMQSKRGAIWAVEWTYRKHRICLTAQEAERVRRVWIEWKKRRGEDVRGHRVFRDGKAAEVCKIVKYDAMTLEVLDLR